MVDIEAYFGGSIVENHCMNFAVHDNKILEEMAAAMLPKISVNIRSLQATASRGNNYPSEKDS